MHLQVRVGRFVAPVVAEQPDADMRAFRLEENRDVDQLTILGAGWDEFRGMGRGDIPMRLDRQPQDSPQAAWRFA